MSVTLDQVPMWLHLTKSSGHVLVQTRSGWHLTLCGTYTPNGERTEVAPKRVCGKCRTALATVTLTPSSGGSGQ